MLHTACLLQGAFQEKGMWLFHTAWMAVEPAALSVFALLPLTQCCAPHTSPGWSCAVSGAQFPLFSLRTGTPVPGIGYQQQQNLPGADVQQERAGPSWF